MKLTTLAIALTLGLSPAVSLAQCMGDHGKIKMSCADGMVFDGKTKSCVPVTG